MSIALTKERIEDVQDIQVESHSRLLVCVTCILVSMKKIRLLTILESLSMKLKL